MIKIENLTKRYGEIRALNGISFEVGEGEVLGFLGPNGAGKSTTMNILCGTLSCDSGVAMVGGIDILADPIAAKRQIGFLPEHPPLYLDMTVREYLTFVAGLKGCELNIKKHLAEICEVTRITDVYDRVIRNLSKGYRQRVGIAQALVNNPAVLVFDEPTIGLDPKQIIEIRNLIKDLGRKHTVILSTHILPEVQAVCDRIVIIHKGTIVANEKTEEISRIAQGNRRLSAKICGPEKEVLAALRGLSGVRYAEVSGNFDMDSTTYIIETDPGLDMRKMLFGTLAKNGWPLIGLEAIGMSLEDVFISAVNESGQPAPRKKRGKSQSAS
ncbi:MAG: ABC transporter ATP-binding protein [Oscillospiraceae bacterium]|nr:ABC transporter ATP-binding protein [Oscillospiraceae bacterium]